MNKITKNSIERTYKNRYIYLALCCVACALLTIFDSWRSNFRTPNQFIFCFGIVFVAVIYLWIFRENYTLTERDIVFIIFAMGVVFRVVYVISTSYFVRQHDVIGTEGHLMYIENIFNGEGIPNEDFSEKFTQYYQPPMWHALCALWLKIQTSFGVSLVSAVENLQVLSLYCSSAIMFLSHKLFRLFGLRGKAMTVSCAIVAFHPTFIILSASINNDVMSLAFSLFAVVMAVKWYRTPNFKNILLLALAIGISMAVKLSGGLVSLGVAFLFGVRLFGKEYKKKGALVAQFASFGAVCVPLALWWQIRNFVKFGIPLTYVTKLPESVDQYIGFRGVFERFFDFSSLNDSIYAVRVADGLGFEYFEYNIILGALKTSVFGEYFVGYGYEIGQVFAKLLFISSAVLAVVSVFAMVAVLVKTIKDRKNDKNLSLFEILMPFLCSATLFVSFVKFCFEYAFFCTMDFRYIALTVVIGALYIGLLIKQGEKNNKMFGSFVFYICLAMTVLMSVSSVALYGTIA